MGFSWLSTKADQLGLKNPLTMEGGNRDVLIKNHSGNEV